MFRFTRWLVELLTWLQRAGNFRNAKPFFFCWPKYLTKSGPPNQIPFALFPILCQLTHCKIIYALWIVHALWFYFHYQVCVYATRILLSACIYVYVTFTFDLHFGKKQTWIWAKISLFECSVGCLNVYRVSLDFFLSSSSAYVWFQGKIFPSHPGFGFYMYGAAAAAAAAAGGGDGGASETAYPPPAHMGIQPLYVDSKTAGKLLDKVLDCWPKRSVQRHFCLLRINSNV